jgi:hypothetical protein
MKKNNNSLYFKDWTTQKLKKEAEVLDYQIYVAECYGTRDMENLMGISIELNKRGISSHTEIIFD